MLFKINVTADDIAIGEGRNCCRCPVARAMQREFPEHYVEVFNHAFDLTAMHHDGQHHFNVTLPPTAERFVYCFDHAGLKDQCVPFAFDLEIEMDLDEAA